MLGAHIHLLGQIFNYCPRCKTKKIIWWLASFELLQVDATALTEAHLAAELDKVAKQYGGGKGIDMTKFPEFNWVEPQLDDIDLKVAEKN